MNAKDDWRMNVIVKGGEMMVEELQLKQGTIICQVCEKVIDIVESPEGVKLWYGMCTDCSHERK